MNRAAVARRCSTTSRATPSAWRSVTTSMSPSMTAGASPRLSSSMMSMPGVVDERAGQGEHLLLAAGERAGGLGAAGLEDGEAIEDPAAGRVDPGLVLAERPHRDAERLVDGELREGAVAAGDVDDAPRRAGPAGPAPVTSSPSISTRPRGHGLDAGDRAEERRLAGAVGAEQRDRLAGVAPRWRRRRGRGACRRRRGRRRRGTAGGSGHDGTPTGRGGRRIVEAEVGDDHLRVGEDLVGRAR